MCGRNSWITWYVRPPDALQERIGPEREEFEARHGAYPALQRIEKVVTTQCRRIAKR